jgi:hypothetical protein
MKSTAKSMIAIATPWEFGSAPNIPKKPETISLVHARTINEIIVAPVPPTIKGLRFPNLLRHLSLFIPTYG